MSAVDAPLAHEDTTATRKYRFRAADGRALYGNEIKTACGKWLTACEDDPTYVRGRWRFEHPSDRPTCPACAGASWAKYPGLHMIITSNLGLPMVVRVEENDDGIGWRCVWGMYRGRMVAPKPTKQIGAVLAEGDTLSDDDNGPVLARITGGVLVAEEATP